MSILALDEHFFDNFYNVVEKFAIEEIIKQLEELDQRIAAIIDRNRYKIVRIDERTITTAKGPITFKRRYYRDLSTKEYYYILDNELRLNKYQRLTNGFKSAILEKATKLPYRSVATVFENNVSKSSVQRIIQNANVKVSENTRIVQNDCTIHIQIDEVFVSKLRNKNKRRYYTCTIFKGIEYGKNKKRNKLVNRRIMSSNSLKTLEKMIVYTLDKVFKTTMDTKIYLSGDLASYIQQFPNRLFNCNAKYVPDKFHVLRDIRKYAEKEDGLILETKDACIEYLLSLDIKHVPQEIRKLLNLYKRDRTCYDTWDFEDYLGCSQEGMNSHYYVPRFKKYGSRFAPETIEKLCRIIEAIENNEYFEVTSKKYPPREYIDFGTTVYLKEQQERLVLDTREMSLECRKLFDNIKYGTVQFV